MNTSLQQQEIILGGRHIGAHHPPVVIAEIGINHEGSLSVAKQMVDAAHSAGVEIVKHQTHIVSDEMSAAAKRVIPGNAAEAIYDIMARCALNEQDERSLKTYVEAKGMLFLSTPFSRAAVDRLVAMNVTGFKIGSGECNNLPLLQYIASFKKPVIMSTGMNDLQSVKRSAAILEAADVPYALLHTTNLYPTPNHLVRLGAMLELAAAFPTIPYGLSDHTTSNHACLAAVALGASIVERHFTDNMQRPGPDIVCSMDTATCKELIAGTHIIKQQLGGTKTAATEEAVTARFAFASVVTTKAIAKGEAFTADNLWVKRPGTGELPAAEYETIIGKRAAVQLPTDTLLKRSHIA